MTTTVLPRTAWTPTPVPRADLARMTGPRGVAVHWPGPKPGHRYEPSPTQPQTAARIRAWRDQHVNGNGWTDLAYQVVIDMAGRVFTGRGIEYRSAANGDSAVNAAWGAVLLVVGDQDPSPAMLDAFRGWRADHWLARYPKATRVVGHRALHSTECPGRRLAALVDSGALTGPGHPTARPNPKPAEDDMPLTDHDLLRIRRSIFQDAGFGDASFGQVIGEIRLGVRAINAGIRDLSEAAAAAVAAKYPPGSVSAELLAAAVADELQARLSTPGKDG